MILLLLLPTLQQSTKKQNQKIRGAHAQIFFMESVRNAAETCNILFSRFF